MFPAPFTLRITCKRPAVIGKRPSGIKHRKSEVSRLIGIPQRICAGVLPYSSGGR
jgi:hypothetical protein